MADGVQTVFAAHPLNPRRWCLNFPACNLQVRSTEHPKRRVIGLGENCFTLPLRDSAGLVHLNVTGLPPLCAAHPGVRRTLSETDSIVPKRISHPSPSCQPHQTPGAQSKVRVNFLHLWQRISQNQFASPSIASAFVSDHRPLSTDHCSSGRSGLRPSLVRGDSPRNAPLNTIPRWRRVAS